MDPDGAGVLVEPAGEDRRDRLDVPHRAGGLERLAGGGKLGDRGVQHLVEEVLGLRGPGRLVGEHRLIVVQVLGELEPLVEQAADLAPDDLGVGRAAAGPAVPLVPGAVGDGLGDVVEVLAVLEDGVGVGVADHEVVAEAGQGGGDGEEGAVEGAGGEGGDAGGLDVAVEGLVEEAEPLVVGAVARAVDVEDGDDQAGLVPLAADAGGGLDVLGGHLRLGEDGHQAEPGDVQADGDHVGRQGDVHATARSVGAAEGGLGGGDLVGAVAGGQLGGHGVDDAVGERRGGLGLAQASALAVLAQAAGDLVLDQPAGAAQLAEAVEVAQQGHVRVGGVLGVGGAAAGEVELLGGRHQGEVGLHQDPLGAAALGGDAEVEAGGGLRGGHGHGEERVAAVGAGGREDLDRGAAEEGLDLVAGAADGRRGGDDLRAVAVAGRGRGGRWPSRRGRRWCRGGRRSGATRPG